MKEKFPLDSHIDPAIESFLYNDDLREINELLRDFSRNMVLPRADEMAERGRKNHLDGKIDEDLVKGIGDLGIYGISVPEEYGGLGMGIFGECLAIYHLGEADIATSLVPLVNLSLFGRTIMVGGTEEQKKKYLPDLAGGKLFGCYALTEEIGSSFSRNNKTTAEIRGNRIIVNGKKRFITEAGIFPNHEEYADRVKFATVFARTGINEPTGKNIFGAFLVPHANPGDRNGYYISGKENKEGLYASPTLEISMDNVEIPLENMLGDDPTKGFWIAYQTLQNSRPAIAAQALGNAVYCFNYAEQYAQETEKDGEYILDKPLHLSEAGQDLILLQTYISHLFNTAKVLDSYGTESLESRTFSSGLKRNATQAATDICFRSMQRLGGNGYLQDYPLYRRFSDSAVTTIYEGNNTVQLDEIRKALFKTLNPRKTPVF